jgi:hypothetical protein
MNTKLTRWGAATGSALLLLTGGGLAAAATKTATKTTKTTVFRATLVQPGVKLGAASGVFTGTLEKNGMMKYTITFTGFKGKLSSAKIEPTKKGVKVSTVTLSTKKAASPLSGTFRPTAQELAAIRAGNASVLLAAIKPAAQISGHITP